MSELVPQQNGISILTSNDSGIPFEGSLESSHNFNTLEPLASKDYAHNMQLSTGKSRVHSGLSGFRVEASGSYHQCTAVPLSCAAVYDNTIWNM